MERTRVWHGVVRPNARDEHERFVAWLGTDEAAVQFGKFFLTGYALVQDADTLHVVLQAEEPTAFIRFLRNRRLWPDFWEYRSTDVDPAEPPAGVVRVQWRRSGSAWHPASS